MKLTRLAGIGVLLLSFTAGSIWAADKCEPMSSTVKAATAALAVTNASGGTAKAAGLEELTRIAIRQVSSPLPAVYRQRGSINKRTGFRRSTHQCGAYVRVALEKAHLIKKGGLHKSGEARFYGCGLRQNGFHNSCAGSNPCNPRHSATCNITPSKAPLGSVLVYDSTGCGHPAGHIEIKTSKGYISDYLSGRPRTGGAGAIGSCRRLIGIWTK